MSILIPNFSNTKAIDDKGNWTPEWANIMQQLISQLQLNYSNEGLKVPQQTTDVINDIGVLPNTPPKTEGSLLVDSTTKELKLYIDGAWHIVPHV